MPLTPGRYDHWYQSARGQWISDQEFSLLMTLLHPRPDASLLDVGCGSGHFTRRFQQAGICTSGLDPDPAMLAYARRHSRDIDYIEGQAEALPFANQQFDYCSAITSLCFVTEPVIALREMWRVCRYGVIVGLLNRHSLLYRQKAGRGAYIGARWDSRNDVINWLSKAGITPVSRVFKSAILLPGGGWLARALEARLPGALPWGGFLAVYLAKHELARHGF